MALACDEHPELPEDHAHILTEGEYSSYQVLHVFRDRATAEAADAELERARTDRDERFVECVAWYGAAEQQAIAAEPAPTIALHLACSMHWNGEPSEHEDLVRFRPQDERPDPADYDPDDPDEMANLEHDLADHDWQYGPVGYRWSPWETNYTLGVSLVVQGTDHDRVRKVYGEQRAQLLADPATATVRAWAQYRNERIPAWIWVRLENAALLDALERARPNGTQERQAARR